ncbi:integral membrane sensor signal transduction histidine kinase [Mycobacteroides abscessus subsp. abscessus]|nr:integral membrane sensor signal transduction histidine kinase [Mycobacteroides abscessus subsp. abscessus]
MIIGLLICAIGMIPIVLAISVNKIYKKSNLTLGINLVMLMISGWQLGIGVLYFTDLLDEQSAFWLFRIFRFASTFSVPAIFFVAYCTIKSFSVTLRNDSILNRVVNYMFTMKMLIALILWTSFVYFIGWTDFGMKSLETRRLTASGIEFYFPVYGKWAGLYVFHMASLIIFLLFLFYISTKIHNTNIRNFLKHFSIYTLFLFLLGLFNFNPETGIIIGSLGVIIFSIMVIFEFIKLNAIIEFNYYQLRERQKKLDFTGNFVGSLIHEMKNTSTIIRGFSKLIKEDKELSEMQQGALDMIYKATEQLEQLSFNYNEYIIHSKMSFKTENIVSIIKDSIELSREYTNKNNIKIELIDSYINLKAFVNKSYLQQVFINLIKNSSEAIPPDREERKITIHTNMNEDCILIDFFDTGKGIPESDWDRIFDPFVSSKNGGTGMGLPFVKKIIFEHRGDIVVVDSTSLGTHITITIPQLGSDI